ncbi:MAG: DUF3667 domain-containing protein [Chthoniobacterales bacterium]
MSDETTPFILGDAAVDALATQRKRRFFRRKHAPAAADQALTDCENCGAPLAGEFCAKCGQHAIDYRRSLVSLVVDAADSFFNWDTKFLKSVGILLLRPWQLTNDFNAGRRVRYVHPLRLYLLASVAFFLLARMVNLNSADSFKFDPNDRQGIDTALAKLTAPESPLNPEERAKVDAARAQLAQMNAETLTPEQRRQMQAALGTLIASSVRKGLREKDHAKLEAALDRLPKPIPSPAAPGPDISDLPAPPAVPSPTASLRFSEDPEHPNTRFENWLQRRIKDKVGEDGTKVQLFLDTLRSNLPTMMLFCIPLFALILKVLYLRKRRFYVEHLVYALHIHSFVYADVVLITLLAMGMARFLPALRGWLIGLLSVVLIVQVFLSIRRVYGQGWFFSTMKFFVGGVAYLVILALAIGATAFLTLLLP